jgi:perosamine synthetase
MIPRFKPELDWHELAAVLTLPGKDDVGRFEKEFAKKFDQKHAIAFPYGRTGLMLLLEAMGLKGAEVICPAYTCVVVPHAIVFSGNTPVFVDCKEGDFNMDLDAAEDAITSKTGAIIATSIFGYPVDLDKIERIRKKYPGLKVIQDCAHSFAAEWKGRPVHRGGDAAIFGLNISKMITSIFGGMVTTDNDLLADKLRILCSQRLKPASFIKSIRRLLYLLVTYPAFWEQFYGFINQLERLGLLNRFVKYYDEGTIDMPKDYLEGLTAIEAKVGLVQLSKYNDIIKRRGGLAKRYTGHFEGMKDIQIFPQTDGATYSHFVALVKNKEEWAKEYRKKGVQLGELIEYSIPYITVYNKYKRNECPVSKYYSEHMINFPIHIYSVRGNVQ